MTALAVILALTSASPAAPWRHPLYLGDGGLWRQRALVVVANPGSRPLVAAPVTLRVTSGDGDLNLVGARAAALRVCDERGDEMLYALTDGRGDALRQPDLPPRARLTIPVDCAAGTQARYYVYFDNPNAWEPPDRLDATGDLRNGGVETGQGDAPDGWSHDAADASHRASWTDETAHEGKRSLKLWVADGAEPTWISTRQSGIRLAAGGRYRMTGWVKAEGAKGTVGWYIHIGDAANEMMDAPILNAGDGTFDWKSVTVEFTAPPGADRASLGTVLRGTGVAWFDSVSLVRLDDGDPISARAYPPERLRMTEVGGDAPWPAGTTVRAPVRVLNLSGAATRSFVSVPRSALLRNLTTRMPGARLAVHAGGKATRAFEVGGNVLFEAAAPAQGAAIVYAYPRPGSDRAPSPGPGGSPRVEYAPNPAVPGGVNRSATAVSLAEYAALVGSRLNLAGNPGFEQGAGLPTGWIGSAEGERPAGAEMGIAEGGLFGKRCARLHVPHTSTPAWTGWRQDVAAKPGRSYLFAVWVRCEDLRGGIQIHAHLRTRDGSLVREGGMVGAGPAIAGTTGWTLLAGTFRAPDDCAIFQMHLTMLATGTAWHDGVLLIEVAGGECLPHQTRVAARAPRVSAWPVNPIVKVFREDLPPAKPARARIVCAGNEYEPLQLAVRSARSIGSARIVVDQPRSATGVTLKEVEIGVVGYVPVDGITNYYSSTSPSHFRKQPTGGAGSDGWPGWWPDPILPRERLDLRAGVTQPVWVTVHVPPGTPRGEYVGAVRLIAGKGRAALLTVPFTVRVLGFDLPRATQFKAIYDCRQSGAMWRIAGKSEAESREAFWRFMAKRRLCPDTIKPEPTLTYRDGVAQADFTDFDRAASVYFDELRMPHAYTPWHFYLFGWGHLPSDRFGEQPYAGAYPYEGVDRGTLRPEFKRAYQACLRLYWDHMKAKGWADRVVLYISDEPHDTQAPIRAQMKALCDMIHEVDPAIPIYSSTWHHQPEWDGKLNVWGIGHYGIVPVEQMRRMREGKARIWWTTDGQMCTDTPYAAIERLLPHYCHKYGAEAYEFWGVDWLTHDPYRFGWHAFLPHDYGPGQEKQWVRYPNGDGFLAYPPAPLNLNAPVTSIRLEQAREGVEDYEYLSMLGRLAGEARREGRDTAAAERALKLADGLVTSPCEIGRYSTRILPDPDKVLRVKEALGSAIEGMTARQAR